MSWNSSNSGGLGVGLGEEHSKRVIVFAEGAKPCNLLVLSCPRFSLQLRMWLPPPLSRSPAFFFVQFATSKRATRTINQYHGQRQMTPPSLLFLSYVRLFFSPVLLLPPFLPSSLPVFRPVGFLDHRRTVLCPSSCSTLRSSAAGWICWTTRRQACRVCSLVGPCQGCGTTAVLLYPPPPRGLPSSVCISLCGAALSRRGEWSCRQRAYVFVA